MNQNKSKLAVIGSRDSVMIFQALGFTTVYAEEKAAIEKAVNTLAEEATAVIYMTEKAALQIPEVIEKYKTVPFPAIIPIPDVFGSQGVGMQGIQENIEKAIGADIL